VGGHSIQQLLNGMKTFVKNRRREKHLIQLGKELVISQKMF